MFIKKFRIYTWCTAHCTTHCTVLCKTHFSAHDSAHCTAHCTAQYMYTIHYTPLVPIVLYTEVYRIKCRKAVRLDVCSL